MACPTSPGAATPANARRWTQRPEGANRGDSGAGDRIGRLDLPTPERVKRAVAEGGGGKGGGGGGGRGRPLLPEPAARPPRRQPADRSAAAPARRGRFAGHPGGHGLTAAVARRFFPCIRPPPNRDRCRKSAASCPN